MSIVRALAAVKSRPKKLVGLSVAALLISTMLLAQSGQTSNQRQTLGKGVPEEQRIAREVRHEILMLPYYTLFDSIGYKVEDDKVTLFGQVTNPTLKSDAEGVVKRIEGVESVENKIEVLPPSPQDDRIRHEVYRSIYGFDGLNRYAWGVLPSIHIIVKNGWVTLVGTVDSETDKNMADIRAKSVPGVFGVTDNLVVLKAGTK